MQSATPAQRAALTAALRRSTLGETILDAACGGVALPLALARAGRRVVAVCESAAERGAFAAALDAEPPEVCERLTLAGPSEALERGPFDHVLAAEVLHRTPAPREWLRRLFPALKEDGTLIVTVPRTAPEDARWRFAPESFRFALEGLAREIVVGEEDERSTLVAALRRFVGAGPVQPRIVTILTVAGEDRYLDDALTSAALLAPVTIALDHDACASSIQSLRAEPTVVALIRSEDALSEEADDEPVRRLAAELDASWVVALDATESLDPRDVERILDALDGAPSDVVRFALPIAYAWDSVRQIRLDGAFGRTRPVRIRRLAKDDPLGTRPGRTLTLDAHIYSRRFLDPNSRLASRVLAQAARRHGLSEFALEPYRLDATPELRPWGEPALSAATEPWSRLLARVPVGEVEQVLFIGDVDPLLVRFARERWSPRVSGVTRSVRRRRLFDYAIVDDPERLDLATAFAGSRFDVVIADLRIVEPSLLERVAAILQPPTPLLLRCTERDVFEALRRDEAFFRAGLSVEAVEPLAAGHLIAARRRVGGRPKRATILASLDDRIDIEDASAWAASGEIGLVLMTESDRAQPAAENVVVQCVVEPSLRVAAGLALDRYPAPILCLILDRTAPPPGWLEDAERALADDHIGLIAFAERTTRLVRPRPGREGMLACDELRSGILVVKVAALPPEAWPCTTTRSPDSTAALCTRAAARGFETVVIGGGFTGEIDPDGRPLPYALD